MKMHLEHGLLFANAQIAFLGRVLDCNNVLIDTGSAGTLFSADHLLRIGLQYEANDRVHRIRGVGGSEFVFTKKVEFLTLATLTLSNFEIEVGSMDYGFDVSGIIGTDFLIGVGAVIDLNRLELHNDRLRNVT